MEPPSAYDITEIEEMFRDGMVLKDRKHLLKTYKDVFVGTEAVDFLVKKGIVCDRTDAVTVGNILLQSGMFHHVHRDHGFEDAKLFYEFTSGHGEALVKDGSKVTWADFIKPVTLKDNENNALQPDITPAAGIQDTHDLNLDITEQLSPLDEHNLRLLDSVHPSAWKDPTPKPKYHMVVIGAGTGGLVTAAGSAGVGARVALIEKNLLGGDCLNYGCVPSKALISAAKAYWHVKDSERLAEFGITVENPKVDFAKVMERLREKRAGIAHNDSAERFAKQLGVDVYLGAGKFVDKNTVEVNGQLLTFARCTIATGGAPRLPDIEGLEPMFMAAHNRQNEAPTIVTNETVFNLTELPPRFAVIGNGAIGLEIAQSMTRFGSDVTVFGRGGRIMGKEDPDVAQILQDKMTSEGTKFELDAEKYLSIQMTGQKNGSFQEMSMDVAIKGKGTHTFVFDALLVAAGRTPNVKGLNLEKVGVKADKKDGIIVNDKLQTSVNNIFAVGDCCTAYKFTHVADFMARIVIRNALFFGKDKFSTLIIPWSTYTEPEVAHVGLYESDINAKKGGECVTVEKKFEDNDRAILESETEGFVRIHTQKGSDKILGATVVGANAGNMISELTLAMNADFGVGSIANVIHPYPTTAESIRACGDLYNKTRLTPAVRGVLRQVLKFQQ